MQEPVLCKLAVIVLGTYVIQVKRNHHRAMIMLFWHGSFSSHLLMSGNGNFFLINPSENQHAGLFYDTVSECCSDELEIVKGSEMSVSGQFQYFYCSYAIYRVELYNTGCIRCRSC